ncbi:MAG: trigger factor [bacterium]|nr:trigger factor [bacterium]
MISSGQFEETAKTFIRKALPESEVELVGEIPYDALAPYREEALKHIVKNLELPGFRRGHVPPGMALQKIGELGVLEEAVEIFIRDFYPALLTAHKVDAVGRPDIRITKLAPQNPVGLTVRAAVYPEVAVPKDWKTLAEKFPLEAYLGELPKTDPPPSPGDEQKARDYMARDKRRGKIIDALLEKTKVAVPAIFVESELEKIMAQMKEDVTKFGLKFEDYLKQMQKTEPQVREEFRAQARKRAVLQLALNKLADDEKVVANPEAVEKEMKHALEHFPDARQDLVRIHIETVLRNEQVLKLLEGEK